MIWFVWFINLSIYYCNTPEKSRYIKLFNLSDLISLTFWLWECKFFFMPCIGHADVFVCFWFLSFTPKIIENDGTYRIDKCLRTSLHNMWKHKILERLKMYLAKVVWKIKKFRKIEVYLKNLWKFLKCKKVKIEGWIAKKLWKM